MKIQNNKTKIATILTSLVIGLVLLSPTTMIPNVHAQITNDQIIPADVASDIIKKSQPTKLSASQLENVKQIVLSDAGIHKIIGNKPYEFVSQSFLGNIKNTPVVWNPVININVDNKTEIAVEVNLNNNSVIKMEVTNLQIGGPIKGTTLKAAFAQDYYTGSATISGLYSTLTAPTYSSNPKVLFLVNGLEYGASASLACNTSDTYNDYFAQAGFDFYDGFVAYADTSTGTGCTMVNSMISYTAGHPYLFEIYSISGNYWDIVDLDQQTGLSNLYTTSFSTSANTLQTSNHNTSVWFENQETSTTWASDFSTSIQATNAKYKNYSTGSWTYWNSDSQLVQDCSGNTKTQNVMNSDLLNGDTQTWNLTNFEPYHC
ncbi:MAG: hypothetical protein ACREA3_10065 [Nitrosotalea sp.]